MEIIRFNNLSFTYANSSKKALSNINLTIEKGSFNLLTGASGSGKTTLLRELKHAIKPNGDTTGSITIFEKNITELSPLERTAKIGYVSQNPEQMIITDKVFHEISFGLENLGVKSHEIKRRVAEISQYLGIEELYTRSTNELSGGEMQIVALASILVMKPDILLLDEPTSALNPIAATELIELLKRMNDELDITIIMTEHRLNNVFPLVDNVIYMEDGKIIKTGTPAEVSEFFSASESGMRMKDGLPAQITLYNLLEKGKCSSTCPITLKDGRAWFNNSFLSQKDEMQKKLRNIKDDSVRSISDETAIKVSEVAFAYRKDSPHVLRNVSLTIQKGTFLSLFGGNGAGKSTLFGIISGFLKANSGKIIFNKSVKKVCTLPQDVATLFTGITVYEEFEGLYNQKLINDNDYSFLDKTFSNKEEAIDYVLTISELKPLLKTHPYDLSGGEKQKLALFKLLMLNPDVLLLDEPTKGLDPFFKRSFGELLKKLQNKGITIVMTSHDVDFSAQYSDECAFLFDGEIINQSPTSKFFSGNAFYQTNVNRIVSNVLPDAYTMEEVLNSCSTY